MKYQSELNASYCAQHLTLNVKVTGMEVFRFRVRLGIIIMSIAAAVIGCQIEIEAKK